MTEGNETLDFHEFVLKLPDSAWNLSSESLEHAAQLAKEGAMSGLSPWQAASLYSKLTGKKTLATVRDTMALVRDALLTLKGDDIGRTGTSSHREDVFLACETLSGPKDHAGPASDKESTFVWRDEVLSLPSRLSALLEERKVLQDEFRRKKMLKHLPVFDEFHRAAVNNAPTHKYPADAEKRRWEQQVKDAMRVLGVVLAREDDTTVAPEAPVSLVLCVQRAAQPWFISAKRKGRRYYARYPIHNVTPPSIDPQRCLARYLEATGDYEGSEIFVSLRKPRKPLSSDAINRLTTRWLRNHLLELGELETDSFSAHSTRGAAATALIYLGVDPHVVAALGDWSCYDTFRKFYDRTRALLRIAQVLVPPDLATGEAARTSRLAIN